MFIPIGHTAATYRRPWVNYGLMAANVVVFALAHLITALDRFALDPQHPAWYQFITYAFVHAGLLHLVGNMLFLGVFGNAVNDRLGHGLYIASYLAMAVLAGIGYLILGTGQPVVGASGAICGVVGFFLVLLAGTEIRIFYWVVSFVGTFKIQAYWLIGLWVLLDIHGMVVESAQGIAYSAHVAGYAFGIAMALLTLRMGWAASDEDDMLHFWRPFRTVVPRTGATILTQHVVSEGPLYDPVRDTPLPRKPARKQL